MKNDLPKNRSELQALVLRALSTDRKMNYSRFAKRAAVSRDTVRFIFERNSFPEGENLLAITKAARDILREAGEFELSGTSAGELESPAALFDLDDKLDRLERLHALKEKGVISDDEYKKLKADVIGN